MLDRSVGFEEGATYQTLRAMQLCRYFDTQVFYKDEAGFGDGLELADFGSAECGDVENVLPQSSLLFWLKRMHNMFETAHSQDSWGQHDISQ